MVVSLGYEQKNMLEIDETTFQAMNDGVELQFVTQIRDFLFGEFPDLVTKDDAFLTELTAVVRRARGHGLHGASSIAAFAVTSLLLGSDFDTAFPPVAVVLAARDMTEDDKTRWLSDWTVEMFVRLEG